MLEQQQQKPAIGPSLAELDTPEQPESKPEDQKPNEEGTGIGENPTTKPSPDSEENQEENQQTTEETEAGEDEPEETEPEYTPQDFWNEVTKLRGDDFKVEFPEEITEQLSPQAVVHILKAAEERGAEQMEAAIRAADSRAYAYMLHRANGGDDATFFAEKTEVLPEWEVLNGSVDLQQAFYKGVLTQKGIKPEHADIVIKDAIQNNELAGLVETEYKNKVKRQEDQVRELENINKANLEKEKQLINKMAVTLQDHILQNKNLPITIPEARRPEFLKYVNNMLSFNRDTGEWYVDFGLNNDNMGQVLSALYYMHVKGNLDDIITKQVNEKKTKELKLRMGADRVKKSSKADPNKVTSKPGVNIPLSEL